MNIATCIGCRCNDFRACVGVLGDPCSWLRVDYGARVGVCSECAEFVARWDAGDRTMASDPARLEEWDAAMRPLA